MRQRWRCWAALVKKTDKVLLSWSLYSWWGEQTEANKEVPILPDRCHHRVRQAETEQNRGRPAFSQEVPEVVLRAGDI